MTRTHRQCRPTATAAAAPPPLPSPTAPSQKWEWVSAGSKLQAGAPRAVHPTDGLPSPSKVTKFTHKPLLPPGSKAYAADMAAPTPGPLLPSPLPSPPDPANRGGKTPYPVGLA